MLGSIIGGAIGAGASIFGGMKASKAMRNVKRNLRNQLRENQNWYDMRYNEDATQRGDAQRILQMTEDNIRRRNQQAAGNSAVMGGTTESEAAAKEANAKALSDTMSQIAVNADRRKDAIEAQYQQKKDSLNEQLNNAERQKALAIAQAAQGVSQAAVEAGGAIDDYNISKKLGY